MGTGHPPILNLRLNSRADTAGLLRAALGRLATPFSLRAELVNEVKTAISAGCNNNAVEHAYGGQSGAIGAHVRSAASSDRVSFALSADEQRLDLTIGPLQPGAGNRLRGMGSSDRV